MSVTVVGIGGSVRPDSQSERALHLALLGAKEAGATVHAITGADLSLPFYDPAVPERTERATELVEALRAADGVIISSPGYHGTVSGLVKNALDYVEDLRDDTRPYLDGRAIGCIGTAHGWQATVTTLQALRSVAHALRGWPTPLGAALNTMDTQIGPDGAPGDEKTGWMLRTIGEQVVDFANSRV